MKSTDSERPPGGGDRVEEHDVARKVKVERALVLLQADAGRPEGGYAGTTPRRFCSTASGGTGRSEDLNHRLARVASPMRTPSLRHDPVFHYVLRERLGAIASGLNDQGRPTSGISAETSLT